MQLPQYARTDLAVDLAGLGPVRDVVIDGNEDQLTQLFDVLLDNALRYTPAGGRVDLAGGVDEDRAWVSVTDTGVGIPANELPLVFDRFHRGRDGGSGLGLAIARHVAEAHGGALTVRSTVGQGTTFTVTLPVLAMSHSSDRVGAARGR